MVIDMARRCHGRTLVIVIIQFGIMAFKIEHFHGVTACSCIGHCRHTSTAKKQHQNHQ